MTSEHFQRWFPVGATVEVRHLRRLVPATVTRHGRVMCEVRIAGTDLLVWYHEHEVYAPEDAIPRPLP